MDHFEDQIRRVKHHTFPEGLVSSIDLKPDGWEHYPIIVFAPGWLGTFLKYESALKELFKSNRRVISVEYVRSRVKVPRPGKYFEIEFQKASMLFGVIREKEISGIHLIAHSEGAINSLKGVENNPHLINKIILLNPAGLIKRDNIFFFLIRFLLPEKRKQIFSQKQIIFNLNKLNSHQDLSMREKAKKIYNQLIGNILKNPFRVLQEAHAISKSSIYDSLCRIRTYGIHTAIIISDNDKVFPEKRIRQDLEEEEIKRGIKIADFLVTLEGEHSDLASDELASSDIDKDAKREFESAEYISSALSILEKLPPRGL